jgi:hypothetical protein
MKWKTMKPKTAMMTATALIASESRYVMNVDVRVDVMTTVPI